jgi:hypothetical protein
VTTIEDLLRRPSWAQRARKVLIEHEKFELALLARGAARTAAPAGGNRKAERADA